MPSKPSSALGGRLCVVSFRLIPSIYHRPPHRQRADLATRMLDHAAFFLFYSLKSPVAIRFEMAGILIRAVIRMAVCLRGSATGLLKGKKRLVSMWYSKKEIGESSVRLAKQDIDFGGIKCEAYLCRHERAEERK